MKKFFIYAALWILISALWYFLNQISGDILQRWYFKLCYSMFGFVVIILGGDYLSSKFLKH